MSCQSENNGSNGVKYATSLRTHLFGSACDVEIVVDLESGDTQASISMRSILRSSPVFTVRLDSLKSCAEAIKSARKNAKLLEQLLPNATDHQLNYSSNGVALIVVHPKDKKARFVLNIGTFNREGELSELSENEVSEAIRKMEEMQNLVRSKVAAAKK